MCERVTIGFDFIFDWLKKWRESISFELGLINLSHSIAILVVVTVSLHFCHNIYRSKHSGPQDETWKLKFTPLPVITSGTWFNITSTFTPGKFFF